MLTLPSFHLSEWQSAAKGWKEGPHQNVHPPHPPWMWMSTGMLFYVNKCHLLRTSVQDENVFRYSCFVWTNDAVRAKISGRATLWIIHKLFSIVDPVGLKVSVVTAGSVSCWMSLIIHFSTVL